jgi:N-[(2S)-2-amino-2-carboxyethyl]-L-glutamate dehydrogenase
MNADTRGPVVPPFSVISGAQVQRALQGQEKQITELVEATYRWHGAGDSVNPPSYFLRFPDRPSSRIIALPASIGGQVRVDGLKWISSFPENVAAGIPRASAVLILNDHETGYPFAVLESSIISATRTAASAALAADRLSHGRSRPTRVGFFGVGLIARYIHTFLTGTGWTFDETHVFDLSANVAAGIPRASAVLVLNDHDTGYPFACMEASIISAARTAASAAAAADWLSRGRSGGRPTRVGFIGTGLIARYVHTYLAGTGWTFDEIGVHDLSADSAAGFRGYLEQSGTPGRVTVHDSAEALIRSSDLVVFATIAGEPHVHDVSWFDHNPLVLHVSLRDLDPEILLASTNVVDDVEHCLKANTSPHLVEQRTGNRDFLAGTLDDVMAGRVTVPADRPVVFSPFGLGVLDLAVGKYVYDEIARLGELNVIEDFFHELKRYG